MHQSSPSLKEVVRKRVIFDMVKSIQPVGKWKVLIVDNSSLAILNSACRFHEILDENVTLIENITRQRQTYPQQEAIYFISPNLSTINALIDDFSKPKPMYAAAHLFCTSSLPDDLFGKIKKSPAIPFVKTFKELNIDFIAVEQQVFTVEMPNIFNLLYHPNIPEEMKNHELKTISKKILSLLTILGENPHIKYFDPTNQKANKSYKLATTLQEEIDAYCQQEPNFPPKSAHGIAPRPGTLLIVERSFDMVAPLLHEFTYQAMINDIIVSQNGKLKFSNDEVSPEGESKKGIASLDEYDPIWRLIRHWHYAEAVEYISDTFNKFISENKAASSALGVKKKSTGIDSLNEMKDTLSALPEFQEMKEKFSLHINICQECTSLFERNKLVQVAGIEQDVVTGETAEGKATKALLSNIVPVLNDGSVSSSDKIRLLMLYIICQDGIQNADKRKLVEYAKLSSQEIQAINNLCYMGLRLTPPVDSKEKQATEDAKGPYTYKGKKAKTKRNNNDTYDLSRFVPLVKLALEDQLTDKIDNDVFHYVKTPPVDPNQKHTAALQAAASQNQENKTGIVQPSFVNGMLVGTGGANPYSLRTLRATWADKPKRRREDDDGSKAPEFKESDACASLEEFRNGPRVILFMIGGMTYSEIRSCYEVMREFKRDVIIGSTHISTPEKFVDSIKNLYKATIEPVLNSSSPNLSKTNSSSKESDVDAKKEDKVGKKLFNVFKKKERNEKSTPQL